MDPKIIKNHEQVLSQGALRRNLKKVRKHNRFSDPLNLQKLGFRSRGASIFTFSAYHPKVTKIDQQTPHFGTFLAQNAPKSPQKGPSKNHCKKEPQTVTKRSSL